MGHRSRAAVAALLVTAAGGSSNAGSAAADFDALRAKAEGFSTDIVHWRRRLHENAELMYQEHNTSLIIQDVLKSLGIKFTTGWGVNTHPDRIPGTGGTGIVAELGTGRPPIVALRADIDALPIREETAVPFRSAREGVMHACGHDGHAAMLLGAARLLKEGEDKLQGTVRLIFQPAEEGGAGAKRMREEGVLRDVSRIFGMHLWPSLPSGTIAGRSGLILAGADFFEFRLEGRGGHGAMPHQAVDPIICGVAVVQSLQTLVSRETDPASSAVVSVTKFNSGDAYNVIPGHATIGGTFRAMTVEALDHLRDRIVRVTHAVASAHQCFVTNVTFMPDYFAPTVNNAEVWTWLQSEEAGLTGLPAQWDVNPSMGAEDFSFFLQEVPGAFFYLGQGSGTGTLAKDFPTTAGLHSPRFNVDESVLSLGSALHAQLATKSLQALGPSCAAASA